MENYVLIVCCLVFVGFSTVLSAPLIFNHEIVKYWHDGDCKFPPQTFYNNESTSIIWNICNEKTEDDLLDLCNSVVIFSKMVCTKKIDTNAQLVNVFANQSGYYYYRDTDKLCGSIQSAINTPKVDKILVDLMESVDKEDDLTLIALTKKLKNECVNYCKENRPAIMCGLLDAVFVSLQNASTTTDSIQKDNLTSKPGSANNTNKAENISKTGEKEKNSEKTVKDDGTITERPADDKNKDTDATNTEGKDDNSAKTDKVVGTEKPNSSTGVTSPVNESKNNLTGSTANSMAKSVITSTGASKQEVTSSETVVIFETTSAAGKSGTGKESDMKTNTGDKQSTVQGVTQNKTITTTTSQLPNKMPTQASNANLQKEQGSSTKESTITTSTMKPVEIKATKQQPVEDKTTVKIVPEELKTKLPQQGQSDTKTTVTTTATTTAAKPVIQVPTTQENQGNTDKNTVNSVDQNKNTVNSEEQAESGDSYSAQEESPTSGHFMAYFLTAVVLCVAGYVIFHNKQKIIAFIVEGRSSGRRSRRPNSGDYKKLNPSMEEVMPSLEKSTTSTNYIY